MPFGKPFTLAAVSSLILVAGAIYALFRAPPQEHMQTIGPAPSQRLENTTALASRAGRDTPPGHPTLQRPPPPALAAKRTPLVSYDLTIFSDFERNAAFPDLILLSATDSTGRVTGRPTPVGIRQEIPGSDYLELGETISLNLEQTDNYLVTLRGAAAGSFEFKLHVFDGDVPRQTFWQYPPIAIATSYRALMFLNLTDPGPPLLQSDHDGDGAFETKISPTLAQ